MDHRELHSILDIGRYKRRSVGARIKHARDRAVVVYPNLSLLFAHTID